METSGSRLKRARAKAGLKTATAAIKRFGWNSSTYRSHENGQTPVPPEDALDYAKAYKTTAAWIVFGYGEIDDPGIDEVLRDKPQRLKQRARRLVEFLLQEET